MNNHADDIVIMRSIGIDAGHRIPGHEGKCRNFHGHRYTFDVYMRSFERELDSLGRVIDFSITKTKIGGWLEQNWDHGMILWERDEFAFLWQEDGLLASQKHFFLPVIPTAENLARYTRRVANELMQGTGIDVFQIVCHETPNCEATARCRT